MNRLLWITLVTLPIACGGSSQKGAASASSSSGAASTLSITQVSNETPEPKFAVSGPAYGFFAPEMGAFNIFVVDASGGGTPDCNHLKELRQTQKGRFVDLWLSGNVSAPGKKAVAGAMYIDATGAGNEAKAGNGRAEGVSISFKTVDAKSFEADVTSDPSAKGPASGSLHGIICDVSALTQGSGGASASGDAPPPPPPPPADEPTYTVKIGGMVSGANAADATKTLARLDPKTKTMVLATWPRSSSPSCDMLSAPEKSSSSQNGTIFFLYAEKVAAKKLGKYTVDVAESTGFGPQPEPAKIASIRGTMDIKRFEDDVLVADLDSDTGDLHGHLTAAVCPPGHVDAPTPAKDAKAKPAKGGGKTK